MSEHNATRGIRQFADELDAYVEKYGALPNELRIDFRFSKLDYSRLCRHFDLTTNPIPDSARSDQFYIVRGKRQLADGLEVHGWSFISDLCESKTVMRKVQTWVCGHEDLAALAP